MRCMLLQQMLLRKLLVEQAERDSVIVNPDEIDANIENRMRHLLEISGQLGL